MRSSRLRAVLGATLLAAGMPAVAAGQETAFPELTGRVVDEAGLLAAPDAAALEAELAQLEAATSIQIVLVALPRIEGSIEDFGVRLATAWGIGQAETDNGALVIVSRDDRRARIEVGYGLEGAIPDGLAGRIIRDELAPRFAAGDFAGGFRATVGALATAASGEFAPPERPTARGRSRGRRPGWTNIGFVLVVLLGWIGRAFHRLLSAGLGVVVAVVAGLFLGAAHLPWLIPLGVLVGFIAPAISDRAATARGVSLGRHRGGGLRGGGFGGFSGGGGSFGGGGASGGW